MIRASGLYGRALIDLDTADRIGYVDEIIVDPYGPCIAGFVVSKGRSVLGNRKSIIVAAEAIYAIGPDALTMRSTGRPPDETVYLGSLPRLSELAGRKMVSFGGKFLGTVEDALIDERDGRIIGYPLDGTPIASGLERLFSLGLKSERPEFVRANADLRVGARLIVVPDDAVTTMDEEERPALPAASHGATIPAPPLPEETPAPERKTPTTRHKRMAVPFSEVEQVVAADARAVAAAAADPGPADFAPVEASIDGLHRPFDDSDMPADEDRVPADDLITTSQIPASSIRGRRSRAAREAEAS
jgi:uncharacterized protein YrrD